MPHLRPLRSPISRLSERARDWSEQSQLVARRNAMVACTALAARRREREDVEEFLAERGGRRSSGGPLVLRG